MKKLLLAAVASGGMLMGCSQQQPTVAAPASATQAPAPAASTTEAPKPAEVPSWLQQYATPVSAADRSWVLTRAARDQLPADVMVVGYTVASGAMLYSPSAELVWGYAVETGGRKPVLLGPLGPFTRSQLK